MNIARIRIENLRCIERLELDLRAADQTPQRRVILLGGNGCGKSTTLATITHFFGSLDPDLLGRRLGADDIRQTKEKVWGPEGTAQRPVASVELDIATTQFDRVWWRGASATEPLPESSTCRYEIGGHSSERNELRELKEAAGPIRHVLRGRPEPPAVYLPADRGTLQGGDYVSVAELSDFDPRVDCLSANRKRFQLLPGILALAYLAPDQNDRDGAVARMWKVAAKYFPELPRPIGVHRLRMLFRTADGATVELPQMSDGQRAVLLILAELALRSPTGGIVLIDELEQHLHPRWQAAILDALVALLPDTQFIVTTQAPYLAAAAPDDVITLGDWKRDGPR